MLTAEDPNLVGIDLIGKSRVHDAESIPLLLQFVPPNRNDCTNPWFVTETLTPS
jgi:hypothetical protein